MSYVSKQEVKINELRLLEFVQMCLRLWVTLLYNVWLDIIKHFCFLHPYFFSTH